MLRFNEAAGIHRRKLQPLAADEPERGVGFNEAAGIHRRKQCSRTGLHDERLPASMRPPEFTGGNPRGTIRGIYKGTALQ